MPENVLTRKPLPRLPYAALPEIRAAIQRRRLVRFHHKGREVVVEPHLLGKAFRTAAFYLKGFNPSEGHWSYYGFCEIRGFEELKDTFTPRGDVWEQERKIVQLDTQAR
jgi:hypothetical protein